MQTKFFLIICLSFVFISTSYGQKKLSKKDNKKWKKKLKATTPAQFKTLYEGYNTLTRENNAIKKQVSTLEAQSESGSQELSGKDSKIEQLETKLTKAKEIIEELKDKSGSSSGNGEDYTKGIVYKVQIGAFRDPKLAEFTATGNWWEEEADGLKKYTIGYFRDYTEADLFKQYIITMGVSDAWVVAYEDNVRRDIKEILSSQGDR